jgi:hypothetical protein
MGVRIATFERGWTITKKIERGRATPQEAKDRINQLEELSKPLGSSRMARI